MPGDDVIRRSVAGAAAGVTRLIQLLRAHGLVAKIPRTRRYRVTAAGEQLMGAAIQVKERHFPQQIRRLA